MNFSGMNPFEAQFDDDEDPLMDNSSSSSSSSNHNNPPKEQNVSFSQPAPTTNKLKKPDEDVIVIEDDEEPSKPTEENKQDAVSDSDSVQIISLEQYKANIEAKKQETSKRLVHILNEDESREVCMNNYKNQMGLELLKKLGKKKKKVLNRNEVYDPVSKSIRKADREFEELMEKELNPTNYAESPFEIEKKKQADLILELKMKLGNNIREAAAERIDKYKIQIKDLEKSVKNLKQTRDSLLYRLSKFDNPEPLNLDALKTEPEPEETAKLRRGSIVKVHSTGILKEVDSIGENGEVLFLGLGNTLVEIPRTDFKRLKY